MKAIVKILRVDPDKRTITGMKIRIGRNAVKEVRRLCRAKRVGWRELQDMGGVVLNVAGGLDVDESMTGWRLKGGDDTAGVSILYGRGPTGGMENCPVNAAWLAERIMWLDGEDIVGREERALEIVSILNDEIRTALRAAVPSPDGAMWLPLEHEAEFEAMMTLGLTNLSTRGQRLTSLGVAVMDLLPEEER